MPYAFAHPAAVVPIAKLLGRRAVPSALVVGSMIPDAWYLVPLMEREHSHQLFGMFWFCLPAALIAYAAFHLIFKQPMLALLPRELAGRLAAWTTPGLPAAPWHALLASLLAGIATHLAWDFFTHGEHLYRLLQHGSTLLGTAFLGVWLWRKLRATPAQREQPRGLQPRLRIVVLAAMVLFPALVFIAALHALNGAGFHTAVRAAGVVALCAFGALALSFSLAWKCWLAA